MMCASVNKLQLTVASSSFSAVVIYNLSTQVDNKSTIIFDLTIACEDKFMQLWDLAALFSDHH